MTVGETVHQTSVFCTRNKYLQDVAAEMQRELAVCRNRMFVARVCGHPYCFDQGDLHGPSCKPVFTPPALGLSRKVAKCTGSSLERYPPVRDIHAQPKMATVREKQS